MSSLAAGSLEDVAPGKGGEIQLTDAIKVLLSDEDVYGFTFESGRFDVGNKLEYLKAIVQLALEREDLGPGFRDFLVDLIDHQRRP